MEIKDLILGQKTRIKGNDYLSTEAYVTPFFEKFKDITDDFIIKAVTPNQISINKDGTENVIYNKVSIEAILPSDNPEYNRIVGMAYGLDVRKPMAKFFTCLKHSKYDGFIIDKDTYIFNQAIEPETTLKYNVIDNLINTDISTYDWYENINSIQFSGDNDNVNLKLGQWIRFAINFKLKNDFGIVQIATNDIIAGYKSLYEDSKSELFASLGNTINYSNIYNAFSNIIYNGKDILNTIDKTRLLKDILSL